MFRRHSILVLAAVIAVGLALRVSTPYVIVALAPLYLIAVDRGLRAALLAAAALVGAQLATMDHWVEPVSAAVLAAGVIGAARYSVLRRASAERERELLAD